MNGATGMGAQIIRPQLAFEREFGQHRNWWVRDARICGNPLSIYLFLLSHEQGRSITQTEARSKLALGERAWVSAKKALLEAGFLVEVRDRFPAGHPRALQRRFRLFLQDPEQGTQVEASEALIELDQPYEEWLEQLKSFDPAKRRVENGPDSAKRRVDEKPQFTPTPHYADSERPTLHNAGSLKEEKTGWLVGSFNENQPTNQTNHAREAEIDAELDALHPELRITLGQIRREVNGRVDLDCIDVVQAVRDTVIRAAGRGSRVQNPAVYVAMAIVRNPESWALGAVLSQPFEPVIASDDRSSTPAADCHAGNHWWGAQGLPEIERAHCVPCGIPRRQVDPEFDALEAQLVAVGGDS